MVVALQHPDAWVIGSDQVAVRTDASLGELILGKPGVAIHGHPCDACVAPLATAIISQTGS